MIATAAESNPSCFLREPLVDLEETLVPDYLRMVSEASGLFNRVRMRMIQARYLKHNWGLTKFCVSQFTGRNPKLGKSGRKAMKQHIAQAKCFEDMEVVIDGWERGEEVFDSIWEVIRSRERETELAVEQLLCTPEERIGLVPKEVLDAPRWPINETRYPRVMEADSPTPDRPIRVQGLAA
jgi:tRNA-dihydrouridine synthase 2